MREQTDISEEYAGIAAEVIREHEDLAWINETEVTIGYMSSNKKKRHGGKHICADCRKIPDRDKRFIPFDFLITVYDPNVDGFSEEQMKILIYHELLHVGVDQKEDGSLRFYIVPHDIEDFTAVIDKYGEEWARTDGAADDI